jgi:hypothetical protein
VGGESTSREGAFSGREEADEASRRSPLERKKSEKASSALFKATFFAKHRHHPL